MQQSLNIEKLKTHNKCFTVYVNSTLTCRTKSRVISSRFVIPGWSKKKTEKWTENYYKHMKYHKYKVYQNHCNEDNTCIVLAFSSTPSLLLKRIESHSVSPKWKLKQWSQPPRIPAPQTTSDHLGRISSGGYTRTVSTFLP